MDLTDQIIDVISKVINKDVSFIQENKDSKLWDSFMRIEVIFALEEKFNRKFSQEEIMKMDTVNHIVEVLK